MGPGALIRAVGLEVDKRPIMTEAGGRSLRYNAVAYVLEGQGSFEAEDATRTRVEAGSVIHQLAGRWHCFDPDPGTTWTEYWILYDGGAARSAFGSVVPPRQGTVSIRRVDSIVEAWEELHDVWFLRQPGYVEYACFLLHRIIVEIHLRHHRLSYGRKDSVMLRIQQRMRASLSDESFDVRELAGSEYMSYELFRKRFKEETGLPPNQYLLKLRVNRARELLLRPGLSVKEIAAQVGFGDPYYFSRQFKKKTGLSPRHYRDSHFVAAVPRKPLAP